MFPKKALPSPHQSIRTKELFACTWIDLEIDGGPGKCPANHKLQLRTIFHHPLSRHDAGHGTNRIGPAESVKVQRLHIAHA